jgi:hypothetical protein
VSDDPFIPLGPEENDRIEAARDWVKGHFASDPEATYATLDGKLEVIATVLENGWGQRRRNLETQALGVAFGDALAQKLMLDWVTVDDEFGRDPALNWPGTSILSLPLTMISKRVEEGVNLDAYALFTAVGDQISQMAFSGRSE